ncbi:MAG: hypothetical protein NT120_02225 [Candidatus Aenigmarchaeota archaeon]|nr:hypothetical protein [Candidatus Aenigmarchaeota archaeon]
MAKRQSLETYKMDPDVLVRDLLTMRFASPSDIETKEYDSNVDAFFSLIRNYIKTAVDKAKASGKRVEASDVADAIDIAEKKYLSKVNYDGKT